LLRKALFCAALSASNRQPGPITFARDLVKSMTNRSVARVSMALLVTALALAAQTPAQAQTGTVTTLYGPGSNLLTNPGHEHPGAYFGGRGEINVTWNWVGYWEEPPPGADLRDQSYRTPEFRPPFARDFPERVKSGGGSDRWFNYFALNKKAGIMQYVAGVPFGAPIRFSSHVQLWSSNDNNVPARSTNDGNMLARVCIDQDGGPRNMDDPELKCSDWAQPYDKWVQLSVDAVAKNNVVSVLIWTTASIPVEHNDAYADESCFEVLPAAGDKGICLGAGFIPTGANVQPLPANYVEIKSQLGAQTGPLPANVKVTAPAINAPAAAANVRGNLNVRSTAATTGRILTRAPRGAIMNVLGKSANGRWYKVSFNGVEGWVSAAQVVANPLATSVAVTQ
jgi:Bacterial SH3 domain